MLGCFRAPYYSHLWTDLAPLCGQLCSLLQLVPAHRARGGSTVADVFGQTIKTIRAHSAGGVDGDLREALVGQIKTELMAFKNSV